MNAIKGCQGLSFFFKYKFLDNLHYAANNPLSMILCNFKEKERNKRIIGCVGKVIYKTCYFFYISSRPRAKGTVTHMCFQKKKKKNYKSSYIKRNPNTFFLHFFLFIIIALFSFSLFLHRTGKMRLTAILFTSITLLSTNTFAAKLDKRCSLRREPITMKNGLVCVDTLK